VEGLEKKEREPEGDLLFLAGLFGFSASSSDLEVFSIRRDLDRSVEVGSEDADSEVFISLLHFGMGKTVGIAFAHRNHDDIGRNGAQEFR